MIVSAICTCEKSAKEYTRSTVRVAGKPINTGPLGVAADAVRCEEDEEDEEDGLYEEDEDEVDGRYDELDELEDLYEEELEDRLEDELDEREEPLDER